MHCTLVAKKRPDHYGLYELQLQCSMLEKKKENVAIFRLLFIEFAAMNTSSIINCKLISQCIQPITNASDLVSVVFVQLGTVWPKSQRHRIQYAFKSNWLISETTRPKQLQNDCIKFPTKKKPQRHRKFIVVTCLTNRNIDLQHRHLCGSIIWKMIEHCFYCDVEQLQWPCCLQQLVSDLRAKSIEILVFGVLVTKNEKKKKLKMQKKGEKKSIFEFQFWASILNFNASHSSIQFHWI